MERPHLVISEAAAGQSILYECSLCGQKFVLPEDRTPREGASEILAAFRNHIREEHAESERGEQTAGTQNPQKIRSPNAGMIPL